MATIRQERGLSFDDVVLAPHTAIHLEQSPNSRKTQQYDISTEIAPDIRSNTPWVTSNMRTVTGVLLACEASKLGIVPTIHQFAPLEKRVEWVREARNQQIDKARFPNANIDSEGKPLIAAAIGYLDAPKAAKVLWEAGAKIIVLDSANGATRGMREQIREITLLSDSIKAIRDKEGGEEIALVAGNVATENGARLIFEAAQPSRLVAKVGIGSGIICGTGALLKIHVPQVTAAYDVGLVASDYNGLVWSDGGVGNTGDASVAAVLANGVMMGRMFAAVKESAALKFQQGDQRMAIYQGSASIEDRKERNTEYPGQFQEQTHVPREGFQGAIPVTGTVYDFAEALRMSLESSMYYVGAPNLDVYREYGEIIPLSPGSQHALNSKLRDRSG